jgi:biopolymer transport protein ExbB
MTWLGDVLRWFAGGSLLMPLMLGLGVTLYAVIAERAWTLAAWPSYRRPEPPPTGEAGVAGDDDETAAARMWVARSIAVAEACELTRGFTLIQAITTVLPLLGLLGTVSGMIVTFAGLQASGLGQDSRGIGVGIGLGLIPTQYGMALAIPGVIALWCLRQRVAHLVAQRAACLTADTALEAVEAVEAVDR